MKIRLLIFVVLIGLESFAQSPVLGAFKKGGAKFDIGMHGGGVVAITDVKRYTFYPASSPDFNGKKGGFGFTLGYPLNHVHSFKLNYLKGKAGDVMTPSQAGDLVLEENYTGLLGEEGLKFQADFYTIGLLHYLNLNQWLTPKERRVYKYSDHFNLKTILGLDAVYYRSYTTILSDDHQVALDPYGSVMYRGYDDVLQTITDPTQFVKKRRVRDFALTTGLEASYKLTKKLAANGGFKYSVMQSDLFDGWAIAADDAIVNDKLSYVYLGLTFMIRNTPIADEWTTPIDDLHHSYKTVSNQVEGLLLDADNDGVSDQFDRELNTPAGALVDGSGVSIDADSDGVIDLYDKERFSALGAVVDADGVELDDDKDGIPNSKDLEPNTVAGGIVDVNGRTIEISTVAIPADVATSTNYVNTAVNSAVSGVSNGFLPSIYFETASSQVHPAQYKLLASVVQTLLKNPSLHLKVVGHTDSRGPVERNETLGYARAAEVVRILTTVFGVPLERFEIETRGETQPLALPPAMQLEVEGAGPSESYLTEINRRVDFQIAD